MRTSSLWTTRALVWSAIVAALACAAVILSLRYWLLPNIDSYRDDIAAAVSRAANARITIGRISAEWEGVRPRFKVERLSVFDKEGRPALELERVESTLSWRSLLQFGVHFRALDIHQPTLAVRRDANGVISVAGIEMKGGEQRAGFGEWLLQQPDVEVHDATVSWTDEQRGAPPLELTAVDLHIVNRGNRHRFGLRAGAARCARRPARQRSRRALELDRPLLPRTRAHRSRRLEHVVRHSRRTRAGSRHRARLAHVRSARVDRGGR
jgi:uncharacterized protein YhdP